MNEEFSTKHQQKFDLFVSYSTDPDYHFVRQLEAFLEGFHRLRTSHGTRLRPLQICVDGSDFRLPRLSQDAANAERQIPEAIRLHLAQCNELLVICSFRARTSAWVNEEIKWFLENRGHHAVRLAVTEGVDPSLDPETLFPSAIIEAGLHRGIWYDFRGFHRKQSRNWKKVRDLDDERTRLAADLNGLAAGEVLPIWHREQRRQARRRQQIAAGVALVMTTLALIAGWTSLKSRSRLGALLEEQGRQELLAGFHPGAMASLAGAYEIKSLFGTAPVPLRFELAEALAPLHGRELSSRNRVGPVIQARLSSDGTRLIALGKLQETLILDAKNGAELAISRVSRLGFEPDVTPAAASKDGNRIIRLRNQDNVAFCEMLELKRGAVVPLNGDITLADETGITPDGSLAWVVGTTEIDATRVVEVYDLRASSLVARRLKVQGDVKKVWAMPTDQRLLLCVNRKVKGEHAAVLELWEILKGERLGVLTTTTNWLVDLRGISNDGNYAVFSHGDMKHQRDELWNLASPRLISSWSDPQNPTKTAVFSADGNYVLLASHQTARIVATASGSLLADIGDGAETFHPVLPYDYYSVSCIDVALDGKQVATLAEHPKRLGFSMIAVWDAASGKSKKLLIRNSVQVTSVRFHPNGNFLVTGAEDGVCAVWDVVKGHLLTQLRGHTAGVRCATFSDDGSRIVTAGEDGAIIIWNWTATTNQWRAHLRLANIWEGVDGLPAYAVHFPIDRAARRVISGRLGKDAAVWDLDLGLPIKSLQTNSAQLKTWTISGDGAMAAVAYTGGSVSVWTLNMTAPTLTLSPPQGRTWIEGPVTIALSDDGKRLLAHYPFPEAILVWDVKSGQIIGSFEDLAGISLAQFSIDGHSVLLAGGDGSMTWWSLPGLGKGTLKVMQTNGAPIRRIAFTEDGRHLATGAEDGTVRVWDLENHKLLPQPDGHAGKVNGLAFSRSKQYLITCGEDATAKIWETASGKLLHVLVPPHERRDLSAFRAGDMLIGRQAGAVEAAVFGADDKLATTGSIDEGGTIRLWDVQTGKLLIAHRGVFDGGGQGLFSGLAFTTDGNELRVVDDSGTAQFFPIRLENRPPSVVLDLVKKHVPSEVWKSRLAK